MANAERSGGRSPRRRRSLLGGLVYWSLVLAVWGAIFLTVFLVIFSRGLPDTSQLTMPRREPSVSYLDRNGGLLAVRGSQSAPPVDIDRLPPYVPAAFVSIEDRRFYHHLGFDPVGIARALVADVKHGHTVEGASTITQQLARNLFLTPDQNMRRKVQELILAVWLERKYSKKEILGLYLNRVYFGSGAYGIESASQRFFNKPASKLTIGEAALLAGLLKSPSHYSPISDQERAGRRATIVLDKMVETGAITPQQRDEAFARKVRVSQNIANAHAQYFVDWVDGQVRKLLADHPDDLDKDLVVETTLDLPVDAAAENAARAGVAHWGRAGVKQAAVVAMDGEGRVRALIGGVNYADSQFDRATDARRQAGSSWKPFVYLTAMEDGRTPDTQVVDEPVTIDGWSPHNFEPSFLGSITLQTALAKSVNTVAARLADQLGRDKVADTARRLGITTTVNTDPAMALGTSLVHPIDMARAYVPFANGGRRVEPYGVERIRTGDGQVLYQHTPPDKPQVIGNPALTYMNRMLRQVLVSGTGTKAAIPAYDVAGKTGTTSDYKDAWFVGYTGGFVTAVWVGKDDDTPMRRVTGGGAPAEIWRTFMLAALPRVQAQAIPRGPDAPPVAPSDDPIGDLLAHNGMTGGDAPAPTPEAPADPGQPADSPPAAAPASPDRRDAAPNAAWANGPPTPGA